MQKVTLQFMQTSGNYILGELFPRGAKAVLADEDIARIKKQLLELASLVAGAVVETEDE